MEKIIKEQLKKVDEIKEKKEEIKLSEIFDFISDTEVEIGEKKEKLIINAIKKASEEEYREFLTGQFINVDNSQKRQFFSEKILKEILIKDFDFYKYKESKNKENKNELQNFTILNFEKAFKEYKIQVKKSIERGIKFFLEKYKNNEPIISDELFKAAFKICKNSEYESPCHSFFNLMRKYMAGVSPDVFIDEIVDVIWMPEFSQLLKNDLIRCLERGYIGHVDNINMTATSSSYGKAIIKNLDFKNPDNFYKTGVFLEFLRKFHALAGDWSFFEKEQGSIKNIVNEAVKKNEGSYLLRLRAADIAKDMKDWESGGEGAKRRMILERYNEAPYQMAPGVTAYFDERDETLNINKDPKNPSMLLPINIEDITLTKKESGISEDDKQLFFDFLYLSKPKVRQHIFKDLGINLYNVPLYEQVYFLQFIKNKTKEDLIPIKKFTEIYKSAGFHTFLSMEHDRTLGDKILKMGEKLNFETARAIFSKYSEIIDSAQEAIEYFRVNFIKGGEVNQGVMDHIEENLFKKGKDFLAKYADDVERGKIIDEAEVLRELENIKTEIVVFASSFRVYIEEFSPWDLADLPGIKYSSDYALKLLDKNKDLFKQMEDIYRKNYKNYPLEFTNHLLNLFKKSLKNPETILYTFEHKKDLVAFCRLEKKYDEGGDKFWHIGSFNVDPLYQKSRFGETLFDGVFMDAGAIGIPIKGDCDPFNPITKYYFKKGFVATDFYNFKGVPSFKIENNESLNNKLKSIKITKENIIKIDKEKFEEGVVVDSWAIGEKPEFNLLNQGYLLTQYFTENNRLYAVFEKNPLINADKEAEELKKAA